jgi:hypothetical protein
MDFVSDNIVCGTDDVWFDIRLVSLMDICQSFICMSAQKSAN